MPTQDVTAANSTITIDQAGIYEITYSQTASVSAGANVTFAVRVNGENIPDTVSTRLLAVGVSDLYSGSVIVSLDAGDVVDMAVSSTLALTVTLGDGVNATLVVKKLSDQPAA